MHPAVTASAPAPRATCPACAWVGPRTRRGPITAHKRTERVSAGRGTRPDRTGTRAAGERCDGPDRDREIARAIGAAFYAAGRAPMPRPERLSTTVPPGTWDRDVYRYAPPWARYMVSVLAPIAGPLAQHDVHDARPIVRRTVAQLFADRASAERFAAACAAMLPDLAIAAGCERPRDHAQAGYVTISVLHRAMKRWEALATCHGPRARHESGPDTPIAYTAIDPGGTVVRHTDPAFYAGYGDEPSRSLWERTWERAPW